MTSSRSTPTSDGLFPTVDMATDYLCKRMLDSLAQAHRAVTAGTGYDPEKYSSTYSEAAELIRRLWLDLEKAKGTPCSETMTVPAGWKLVPIEPTEAMMAAYRGALKEMIERLPMPQRTKRFAIREPFKMLGRWRAMLAAAPEAPQQ